MKILGIDTSTKFLCIGLYDSGKIYEYNLELGRLSSNLIMPAIKNILQALGWRLEKIDYLACGLGPGSFTGIRVGLGTVKGLAWPLNKKIAAFSSLDILACAALDERGLIMPAVDAKRGLIYTSAYKNISGKLKRVLPYSLLTKENFIKSARRAGAILGDALEVYGNDFRAQATKAKLMDKDHWYPKPRNLIRLALEQIKEKKLYTTFDIKPIYLYPADCQIKKV